MNIDPNDRQHHEIDAANLRAAATIERLESERDELQNRVFTLEARIEELTLELQGFWRQYGRY